MVGMAGGNGHPGKAVGFVGERTSDGVSEPSRERGGEGYKVREDEVVVTYGNDQRD